MIHRLALAKSSPNNPNITLNLAIAGYKDGDIAQATGGLTKLRAMLGMALIRDKQLARREQLATNEVAVGNVAEARKQLESLLKESPDSVEAHVSDQERAIVQKLNEAVQAKQRQEFPAEERRN